MAQRLFLDGPSDALAAALLGVRQTYTTVTVIYVQDAADGAKSMCVEVS